jgi:hypothetical protein
MTERNPLVDVRHASESVSDVDTDGSGDTEVVVGGLRQIEDAADVSAQATGGYTTNVQSVTGNSVTVRIFESAGSAASLSPVTGGSDVTDVNVSAVGQ